MTAFFGNLLGGLLKLVYDFVSSTTGEIGSISHYAIAIILTTIIFRLILLPLSIYQSRSTKKMAEIQPKIQEIQKKYKNDPRTQQMKMAEVYRENKYNPASGCLPLLIQLPIIIAFFNVLRDPVRFVFGDPNLYETINKSFVDS